MYQAFLAHDTKQNASVDDRDGAHVTHDKDLADFVQCTVWSDRNDWRGHDIQCSQRPRFVGRPNTGPQENLKTIAFAPVHGCGSHRLLQNFTFGAEAWRLRPPEPVRSFTLELMQDKRNLLPL